MQQIQRLLAPALIALTLTACVDVVEPVQPANTFALTTVERSHLEAQLKAIVPALEAQGHPAADIMAKYGPEVVAMTSEATLVSVATSNDPSATLPYHAVGVELTVFNRDGAPDLTLRAVALWRDTTDFIFGYSELVSATFPDSAYGTVYERPDAFWSATSGSLTAARTTLGGTCPGVLLPDGVTCATADFNGRIDIEESLPAVLDNNIAVGIRTARLAETALVGIRVLVDASVFEGL